MRNRRWMCALEELVFGLGVSETAWAKDPSELHQDASAFTEARYEEALRLFKEAYDATNTPEMLVRIGQTQLKLGRKSGSDGCLSVVPVADGRSSRTDVPRALPVCDGCQNGLFPASSSAA